MYVLPITVLALKKYVKSCYAGFIFRIRHVHNLDVLMCFLTH